MKTLQSLYKAWVGAGPVDIAYLKAVINREIKAAQEGKIRASRAVISEWKGDLIAVGKLAKRQSNPRPRIGAKRPTRASSATGKAPTKRLVKRRKANTVKGFFPNPKVRVFNKSKGAKGKVGYAVHSASQPYYNAIAWFSSLSDAKEIAQEAADRTGKQLKITKAPFLY